MMYIYSVYVCDISSSPCREIYVYCRLCLEMMHNNNRHKHESKRHKEYFAPGTFRSYDWRNFNFSGVKEGIQAFTDHIGWRSLAAGTSISLLNFDNTKPPEELLDIINNDQFRLTDSFLITALAVSHVLNNNHSCMFCGEDYETLPSEKMVYNHLKTCGFVVRMREANRE